MDKSLSRDLLEGSVMRNLLKMSLPTMLGYLFQAAYDIVDMIWIGMLSSRAVAGVTIFLAIFWMVDVLNSIIGVSSISLISQSYGSGDKEKTSIAVEQTITFKALVAVIAAALILAVLKPLIGFFTDDAAVKASALEYGYIRLAFLPAMFSSFTVNTAFRCIGDARKPMIILVISSVINIVLDPVLMFDVIPGTAIAGFGMGVFGAALATVISTTAAFLLGLFLLLQQKDKLSFKPKRMFTLNREIDFKLLTIGLPNGIEMFARNLSTLVTMKFVSLYGTAAVASFGIGSKLFNFAFMPIIGMVMGSSAIIGQCLGDNNIDRASSTARLTAVIGFVLSSAAVLLVTVFPAGIMGIFTSDPEVIRLGIPMVRIIYSGLLILSVGLGLGAAFEGAGYNLPYLVSCIISRWGVHIPLLVLLVSVLKLDVISIWIVFLVSDCVEGVILFLFYRRGRWKQQRVY